jgi:DNA-binding NarL/FixJ family response regulator
LAEPVGPRVLIADLPAIRFGVRIALEGAVQVCAEAGAARDAISAAQRQQPDVSLIGLDLPGDGIVAIRGICDVAPKTAAIALAASQDADDLLACIHAGAVGYLPHNIDAASLRHVVAAVRAGEAAVPRHMVLALVREVQRAAAGGDGLTPRETEVVDLLRRGRSTAAIAHRLGISPVTVRRHISTSMRKIGAEDRTALTQPRLSQPSGGDGSLSGTAVDPGPMGR